MNKNKTNSHLSSPQSYKEIQPTNTNPPPHATTIDEMDVIQKTRYVEKKSLIETSEWKNSSGYKYLKVWELYQPKYASDTEWEYGKKGILIPINEAKRWVKRLYQHYYPNPKNPSK